MRKLWIDQKVSALFIIIFLLAAGCSSMDPDDESDPPDGAVAVPLDTSILVSFSMPMDTASCETRFRLHVGAEDSNGHMMSGGNTSIGGHFSWNGDHTEMTFSPDSMFIDSAMYTYHLDAGMRSHDHDGTMMMPGMNMHGQETEGGITCAFLSEDL